MHTSYGKSRQVISLLLNLAAVVMAVLGLSSSMHSEGAAMLRYYTQDSNFFGLAACAICAGATVYALARGSATLPAWVGLIKYMATCCLTVTLLVVIFILTPMMREFDFVDLMLSGSMLYLHFLCPVTALVSFLFFEPAPWLARRHAWYALLPTLIYAAITLTLNIARVMVGPYPFLHVYEQPVYLSCLWVVLILGGAYGLARLIRLINRKMARPA